VLESRFLTKGVIGVVMPKANWESIMADKPDKVEQVEPGKLTVSDTGLARFIVFEAAPSFGNSDGVVNITLAAIRHLLKDGALASDAVAVAYLKCSVAAAIELRDAIDSALLLGAKTERPN
jgi:hypothetical protein